MLLVDDDGLADGLDRIGSPGPAAEEVVVSELFEAATEESLAALSDKHRADLARAGLAPRKKGM